MPEKLKFLMPKKFPTLVNHALVSGQSGSGKSNASEIIITNHLKKDWKCIDVYDSGRFENFCYALKEDNIGLIKRMQTLTNNKQQPKSYPTEIIMIGGSELKYNKKLPKNVNVMSFDQEDLNIDDLYFLLGKSERLQGHLALLEFTFGDDLNLKDMYDILASNTFRGEKVAHKLGLPSQTKGMILRNITRWLKSGMFSDKLPKINFERMLNATKNITSFSTYLLESEESERIAYGIILKKINDLKRKRKVKARVLVYIRELSVFFQEGWGMSRKYLLDFIRQGRDRGVDLLCDMQRAKDIKTVYRRQFGINIKMRSQYADAESLWDIMPDIPKHYLIKVSKYAVGEAMLVTGSEWHTPVFFPPTAHKHKKPGMNVLGLLGNKYGWRTYTDQEINEIFTVELKKAEVKNGDQRQEADKDY